MKRDVSHSEAQGELQQMHLDGFTKKWRQVMDCGPSTDEGWIWGPRDKSREGRAGLGEMA